MNTQKKIEQMLRSAEVIMAAGGEERVKGKRRYVPDTNVGNITSKGMEVLITRKIINNFPAPYSVGYVCPTCNSKVKGDLRICPECGESMLWKIKEVGA